MEGMRKKKTDPKTSCAHILSQSTGNKSGPSQISSLPSLPSLTSIANAWTGAVEGSVTQTAKQSGRSWLSSFLAPARTRAQFFGLMLLITCAYSADCVPQFGCENGSSGLINLPVFQHMNARSTYVDNSTLVAIQIYKNYLQQLLQEQEPLMGTLLFGGLGVGLQLSRGGGQEFVKLSGLGKCI